MGSKTWLNLGVLTFISTALIGCNTEKNRTLTNTPTPRGTTTQAKPPVYPTSPGTNVSANPTFPANPQVSSGYPKTANTTTATSPYQPSLNQTGATTTPNMPPLPPNPSWPTGTGVTPVGGATPFATQTGTTPSFLPSNNPPPSAPGLPPLPNR